MPNHILRTVIDFGEAVQKKIFSICLDFGKSSSHYGITKLCRIVCKDAFRELDVLTLPSLYVFEVILYCRSKCDIVQESSNLHYETRGSDG